MQAIDPTTGEPIRDYPEIGPEEAHDAVARAHAAFHAWRGVPLRERAAAVGRLAGVLREHAEEYAALMTREMGKPITGARSEVEKCAWVCAYYAENAEEQLAVRPVASGASRSYVTPAPLGVIFAIMPWNFPFWQVIRFAAPALAAGNGVVLKHAPNVPGCALAIQEAVREAGFPRDLFASLLLHHRHAEAVIRDPSVRGVTFTGSTRTGRAVGALAGSALKKTVLELGGSDPYVILEDADLDRAVPACVTGRLINSGQSCIAAKRMIVPAAIRAEFEAMLVAEMGRRPAGDPWDERTEVGPLARADLREQLHAQVEASVAAGARLLMGGGVPEGPGFFYPVSVLTGAVPGSPARTEELFGPVAVIIPAADEEDALRTANETTYGLGAAVFTGDVERGERIAAEVLEAGACFVNDFVRSDPRLPFGGTKDSGWGRELGPEGIREWTAPKTVWIA